MSLRFTRWLGVLLAAAGVASVAVAGDSAAGVNSAASMVPATASLPAPTAPPGVYEVRCWQYGQLIFDERTSAPVGEPKGYALKFQSGTGAHTAAYITETSNATCVVKPVSASADKPVRIR